MSSKDFVAICKAGRLEEGFAVITEAFVDEYKKNKGDWSVYERRFLDLMSSRRIEETTSPDALDGGCLLCSEEKPHHCHRRLVAEYLKEKWHNVEICHIP